MDPAGRAHSQRGPSRVANGAFWLLTRRKVPAASSNLSAPKRAWPAGGSAKGPRPSARHRPCLMAFTASRTRGMRATVRPVRRCLLPAGRHHRLASTSPSYCSVPSHADYDGTSPRVRSRRVVFPESPLCDASKHGKGGIASTSGGAVAAHSRTRESQEGRLSHRSQSMAAFRWRTAIEGHAPLSIMERTENLERHTHTLERPPPWRLRHGIRASTQFFGRRAVQTQ
jgi:hypothetical protein